MPRMPAKRVGHHADPFKVTSPRTRTGRLTSPPSRWTSASHPSHAASTSSRRRTLRGDLSLVPDSGLAIVREADRQARRSLRCGQPSVSEPATRNATTTIYDWSESERSK